MKRKDTNKITKDFISMISGLSGDLQKKINLLSEDEVKNAGIDLKDISTEAEKKVKELKEQLSKYEQKIRSL